MSLARFEEAGARSGRHPTVAARAMVVAPSSWAAQIGVETLRAGGCAVDCAIAVGAALIVAQPHQCGLGGDAFWLVRQRDGATVALDATGRSGAATDAEALRAAGATEVPPHSGAAVTVPGLVRGWKDAHDRFGRLELARLLAPAVAGARDGLAVSPALARQLRDADALLAGRRESARVLRSGGARAAVGAVLRQPDLAATLATLGADPDALYGGPLAEAIAAAVTAEGGWLQAEDLAAHRGAWTEPVRRPFAGWCVEEMPPSSQGVAALVGLGLVEGPGAAVGGARRRHRQVEAARILMAVRDAEIADPATMRSSPEQLLHPDRLDPLRALLDGPAPIGRSAIDAALGAQAAPVAPRPARGDTVHFAIVDEDGMAVSCIQSVFDSFGSGIVVPGTGILLHNRGAGFVLAPGHPNELAPAKRPLHTLAPGMATASGRTAAVFGTMGGNAQAQLHLQLLDGLAAEGLDPASAVDRPRWWVTVDDPELVEAEDREGLVEQLEGHGHRVRPLAPYSSLVGHAQVVVVDEDDGVLMGSADPRSDGAALGY